MASVKISSSVQAATIHIARRSGIINMSIPHKFTIVQMIHISGHKKQKTFMDYIKLSSDEIADEIDAIANDTKSKVCLLLILISLCDFKYNVYLSSKTYLYSIPLI